MYIVVVGGGKIGGHLTQRLLQKGHHVSVVERNEAYCNKLGERLAGDSGLILICGDGCDPKVLAEAGVKRAHVVVAVTGDDEDNLVVCQVARKIFGVKRVVARVNDPRNEDTFHALGVEAAISSTTVIGQLVEEEATIGHLERLATLGKGQVELVELTLDEGARSVGAEVARLGLPAECVLVALVRGADVIIPKGSTVLAANDIVLAVVRGSHEARLREILAGSQRE